MLFFRYGGTERFARARPRVELRIQATSTLQREPAYGPQWRVRDVPWAGARPAAMPSAGKLVELQVFTRGQWRTFAQPRASARTGRWTYPYRFEAIRGHVRFRFRARIRKELGFPYDLGYSRQRSVTVVGL